MRQRLGELAGERPVGPAVESPGEQLQCAAWVPWKGLTPTKGNEQRIWTPLCEQSDICRNDCPAVCLIPLCRTRRGFASRISHLRQQGRKPGIWTPGFGLRFFLPHTYPSYEAAISGKNLDFLALGLVLDSNERRICPAVSRKRDWIRDSSGATSSQQVFDETPRHKRIVSDCLCGFGNLQRLDRTQDQ